MTSHIVIVAQLIASFKRQPKTLLIAHRLILIFTPTYTATRCTKMIALMIFFVGSAITRGILAPIA
jgi:hypothetical protein